MSRVIGILSGKGGVGKTALVANVGASLAKDFGKDVVILDTDMGSSHLGMHFGIYKNAPVTLREVLQRGAPLSQGILVHPETGVRIMAAPLNGQGTKMPPKRLSSIAREMAEDYGMVLMDCPPGLGKEVIASIYAMDAAIVVTTPDFPSVADAMKTLQVLEKMGKPVIGMVVNKSRGKRFELSVKEIESACGKRVISVIPEDYSVPRGVSVGRPVVIMSPFGKSATAFRRLAGALVNESYEGGGIFEFLRSLVPKGGASAVVGESLESVRDSVSQPSRKKKAY